MSSLEKNGRTACALRYVRTPFAKKIRKGYEGGVVKARRCELRVLEPRTDGLSNTITTVTKDNYIVVWSEY